jgi:DNA ligase-1
MPPGSGTPLQRLVDVSSAVRDTSSRKAKIALLSACLADLGPAESAAGVAFLSGAPRQRQTGAGWAALRDLPPPAEQPELTVGEVDAALERLAALAGPGSRGARLQELERLLTRATEAEQTFLVALILGDLRQGALAGVMTEAVAQAAAVPVADVRRAAMLGGDLALAAQRALTEGVEGLRRIRLEVGRPVAPMLAGTAPDVEAALGRIAPAAVEWKLDGARIQVHRRDGDVRVFTRSLDEVTDRVPEVVAAALALPVSAIVLDGEAIALREDGRPHPFQVTASRFASRRDVDGQRRSVPLTALFFDVLHAGGDDLIDRPAAERFAALAAAVPEPMRVPRTIAETGVEAAAFLEDALARGHEGVMVKALTEPYAAGGRGGAWLKVKPRHTLDLVVLAAEWGHGRRRGWLSNLHLGARLPDGSFCMLGKTFKGLTDAMLQWQTERLLELETGRTAYRVDVRPELVVEVAFDGVQRSPRYPGGVALRFARVLHHRPDKRADEADTLESVQAIHDGA